jgi:hypothetical protein
MVFVNAQQEFCIKMHVSSVVQVDLQRFQEHVKNVIQIVSNVVNNLIIAQLVIPIINLMLEVNNVNLSIMSIAHMVNTSKMEHVISIVRVVYYIKMDFVIMIV